MISFTHNSQQDLVEKILQFRFNLTQLSMTIFEIGIGIKKTPYSLLGDIKSS